MTRKIIIPILTVLLFLCACAESTPVLEDTVWKNGNDIAVCFYDDGTGYVDIDGIKLGFTYTLSGNTLDITCTDKEFAESYGLDVLPLFGVNTITVKGGYMYIGSWELVQVK